MIPSTPIRASLAQLNWSVRHLAAQTGWDERTVRRWISGDYAPPDGLVAALDALAAAHRDNPLPRRER